LDIDHILPKAHGGTDEASNLQILCRPCHVEKDRYVQMPRGMYRKRRRTPPPFRGLVWNKQRQAFVPKSYNEHWNQSPMTTTIQPQITVTEHNVAEHVHTIHTLKSAIRETQKLLYETTAAVLAYMQAENAAEWTDGKLKATLKPGAPTYLVNELRAALGEILEPEALDKLIVEGEQCKGCAGSGVRAPRVDGTVARSLMRRGDRYRDALDTNCVRGDSSLTVEEVK